MKIALSQADKMHAGTFGEWHVLEHVRDDLEEERTQLGDVPVVASKLLGVPGKQLAEP